MKRKITWAAEVKHVREVSIRGCANLDFWKQRLAQESLIPLDDERQAQILILAGTMKFRGIRFSEMSISVLVVPPQSRIGERAAYLVHAFNSNRFFAFCERVFFSSPYSHAQVRVDPASGSIEVSRRGQVLFAAAMHSDARAARTPLRCGEDGWEGTVLLPGGAKSFVAKVRGHTETWSFDPSDSITMQPGEEPAAALALLGASGFTPRAWDIRTDAFHAKSKTYRRDAIL